MSFKSIKVFFSGLAMGTADIVPGISGGTVALILGIYKQLIDSIRNLHKFESYMFLLPLLGGIASAFILLSTAIHEILKHPEWRTSFYSLFLGLVLASVVILARQIKVINKSNLLALFIGIVLAALLTLPASVQEELYQVKVDLPFKTEKSISNYKDGYLTHLTKAEMQAMQAKGFLPAIEILAEKPSRFDFKAMGGGMVAVSAMLLPGISGSYLLNMMGMYAPALAALADLSASLKKGTIDQEAAWYLFSMLIGILSGAALFSHVASWLLSRYQPVSLSLLTGFMLGALRSVWPYWETAYRINPLKFDKGLELELIQPLMPNLFSAEFAFSFVYLIIGFSLVLFIEKKASQLAV